MEAHWVKMDPEQQTEASTLLALIGSVIQPSDPDRGPRPTALSRLTCHYTLSRAYCRAVDWKEIAGLGKAPSQAPSLLVDFIS